MAKITAVNVRGEKVAIPEHWIDHPVLGKGFRRPPSRRPRPLPLEAPVEVASDPVEPSEG